MSELVALDVLDRPRGGRRGLRRLPADVPGMRHRIVMMTGRFVTGRLPRPTPLRWALLTVWDPDADVAALRLPAAAEHWHVRGELVSGRFSEPWQGWMPETNGARPLRDEEPALILISGDLRPSGILPFARSAPRVVRQAFGHPGYLGGLALQSSPLNTTSCSAWRTYGEARAYAFGAGRHAEAMRFDRTGTHHRSEWFLRIRPLASHGTLSGCAPFGGVLNAESPAEAGLSKTALR